MAAGRSRKDTGRVGEDAACEYLRGNGFKIVERNWRTSRGELDIIARIEDTTVFVEVKTRHSDFLGTPEESITPSKVRRIRSLAAEYLARCGPVGEVRFDVIGVRLDDGDLPRQVRHIEAAF